MTWICWSTPKTWTNTIIYSDTEELMQEMVMEHMGVDMQAMTNASNSVFGEECNIHDVLYGHGRFFHESVAGTAPRR